MPSTQDLNKFREERLAREKARIEKLREINLKKYQSAETSIPRPVSNVSILKQDVKKTNLKRPNQVPKNNLHVNGTTKRPITAPTAPVNTNKKSIINNKTAPTLKRTGSVVENKINNNIKLVTNKKTENQASTSATNSKIGINKGSSVVKTEKASTTVGGFKNPTRLEKSSNKEKGDYISANIKSAGVKNDVKSSRKSYLPKYDHLKSSNVNPKPLDSRKSIQQPRLSQSASKVNPHRQSVFERLYQPKHVQKKSETDQEKIQKDPEFFKKVVKNTELIVKNRRTMFELRKEPPVRRSVSAVHFRRISKSELKNCVHKWSSVSDNLDKAHLKHINEDESVKQDKIVSAVKSERKKVKFQTPTYNFNTPKPEELQAKLQNWLKKRGKSIDSYHHLQCFGIHHLAQREFKRLNLEAEKFNEFDDEDKENQPLESDSDNESYEDNMNNKCDESNETDTHKLLNSKEEANAWRHASLVSESVDLDDTRNTTLTPIETPHIDEVLLGALRDLTELLKEGFHWEQCARWLRAVRERFPYAPDTAEYWECRAALEDQRGDLPASVQCWEEAIAMGTERSVVESNLDQLLDKFMQLKISPGSGKTKPVDPKMVDVKNVFKSTLIRFAVQQARIRQSQDTKYTVTPVRRSGRLSGHYGGYSSARSGRTPLQVCSSVRQAELLHPVVFVPNHKLFKSP